MARLSQLLLLILICVTTITGLQTLPPTECIYAMDLTFVVDSSGSICRDKRVETCDNWDALRQFMHNIVKDMTIGPNDVRVAMIEFESSAWIKWNLTTYQNKQELMEKIDTLPYTGGTTNTIAALGNLSYIFNVQNGDRPDVRNTAIIITDGKPRRDDYVYPMDQIKAAVRKVTDQDIRLLAVGVTDDIDNVTLKQLSSPPQRESETVFFAKDYLNLKQDLRQLIFQTCRTPGPFEAQEITQCTSKLDLAFVVDSSGSICKDVEHIDTCDNWNALRNFTHALVDSMTIGSNDVRVAMIQFQSNARVRWNLTTHSNKYSLLNALDNLHYSGGTTNTIAALGNLSNVFNVQNGDRSDVRNTTILITDGKPRNDDYIYPIEQIRAAVKSVTDQDIRLLVVGVTDSIDMETLTELSSPPHTESETVFLAKDYLNLKQILNQLQIKTCTT